MILPPLFSTACPKCGHEQALIKFRPALRVRLGRYTGAPITDYPERIELTCLTCGAVRYEAPKDASPVETDA